MKAFAVLLLAASAAFAQNTDVVLHFAHAETPQARQEIVNAIRSISEAPQVSVVNESGMLAAHGTVAQMGLTEWLFGQLDQAAKAPPSTATQQYQVAGDYVPFVRAYTLAHATTPQSM